MHLLHHPDLLDGAKWQLAQHEVHAWATVQWFDDGCLDDPSLGATELIGSRLQTNFVGPGGIPAHGSVGGSAAMASLAFALKSLNAVLEWAANGTAATDRAALLVDADPQSLRTFAAMRSSASRCLENHPVSDG
jgi:hypothetical protein